MRIRHINELNNQPHAKNRLERQLRLVFEFILYEDTS